MKCTQCQHENPDASRFCGNCATPLPVPSEAFLSRTKTLLTPLQELSRGSIFAGRYEILEELGEGGMGKVYRVVDKKINEAINYLIRNKIIQLEAGKTSLINEYTKNKRSIKHSGNKEKTRTQKAKSSLSWLEKIKKSKLI